MDSAEASLCESGGGLHPRDAIRRQSSPKSQQRPIFRSHMPGSHAYRGCGMNALPRKLAEAAPQPAPAPAPQPASVLPPAPTRAPERARLAAALSGAIQRQGHADKSTNDTERACWAAWEAVAAAEAAIPFAKQQTAKHLTSVPLGNAESPPLSAQEARIALQESMTSAMYASPPAMHWRVPPQPAMPSPQRQAPPRCSK